MKLRIIEEIQNVNDCYKQSRKFIIEQKTFWGWKEVLSKQGSLTSNRLTYSDYNEAEKYMYENYMGHGQCIRNGNIYVYTHYSYY